MKRIIVFLLLLVLVINFAACAKCIDTKEEKVLVTITDTRYIPMMMVGKIIQPPRYRIYFTYEGIEDYSLVKRDVYKKYEDKIGDSIEAIMYIETYDDGRTKIEIKLLEGN